MNQKTKRTIGWGGGATFLVLALITVASINGGGMKNLHGQDILSFSEELSDIAPAAGGEKATSDSCGHYIDWIGKRVSEKAARDTGKPFRILGPGAVMTMDHNPKRINIHVNERGIVEDVDCG